MIDVILADPQPILREGVRSILSTTHDIRLVGESNGQAEAVLELIETTPCDVLLADMIWGRSAVQEWITAAQVLAPNLKIIAWSNTSDNSISIDLYTNGVAGYVSKHIATDKLLEVIRTVHAGSVFIPIEKRNSMLGRLLNRIRPKKIDLLSERERQVMVGIARGKSTAELATELGINPKTISTYRARIQKKIGVKTDVLIALYARSSGLINP